VRVKLGALLVVGIAAFATPVVAQVKDGGSGRDRLIGTPKPDRLDGRAGPDILRGRGGEDRLIGGKGRDRIWGGAGRDEINTEVGRPVASGGRDVIRARDHGPDEINCGSGRDRAYVDIVEDGVYDCEEVIEP
jgi:Ca2+-binding RTX toxin-like protein